MIEMPGWMAVLTLVGVVVVIFYIQVKWFPD